MARWPNRASYALYRIEKLTSWRRQEKSGREQRLGTIVSADPTIKRRMEHCTAASIPSSVWWRSALKGACEMMWLRARKTEEIITKGKRKKRFDVKADGLDSGSAYHSRRAREGKTCVYVNTHLSLQLDVPQYAPRTLYQFSKLHQRNPDHDQLWCLCQKKKERKDSIASFSDILSLCAVTAAQLFSWFPRALGQWISVIPQRKGRGEYFLL